MRTVVTTPASHLCPHRDEVDHGEIELTFEGPSLAVHREATRG